MSEAYDLEELTLGAVTVSLINMKGGVGKTTIASQMAHAAEMDDLKVLAVDLDPQSNLSQSVMGAHGYVKHLKENRPTIVVLRESGTRRDAYSVDKRCSAVCHSRL